MINIYLVQPELLKILKLKSNKNNIDFNKLRGQFLNENFYKQHLKK